jgi:hypothetical protein
MFATRKALFSGMICLSLISCSKDPVTNSGSGSGGGSGTPGSVASFTAIPLPTVDVNKGIIPNLGAFYVTNKGPYVQIQNSAQLRRSVYKYHGGSGATAWSSFTPDFKAMTYMPTSFTAERDREFSIYWAQTGTFPDKYGMYNLNNGTTSFEWEVPEDPNGPEIFSQIVPSKKGFHRLWAISGQQIWAETAVAVPKKFELIVELPFSNEQYLRQFFADPDEETVLWAATNSKLYKVGTVSPNAGGSPGILSTWTFPTTSSLETINAIIKVNGAIVVQLGNKVFKQEGTSFKQIGTLNLASAIVANICTNGSTIFASDGTYYNSSAGKWESFIGDGKNLSGDAATRYNELKTYFSIGNPIGVVNGSSGPVYLLTPTHLIQITPTY